jgi:hypothetical protein
MYFYFITFRVINRTVVKGNSSNIGRSYLMSRDLMYTELRPEVLGWRGEIYIKINLSEIDSTSGILKTECNAQDG